MPNMPKQPGDAVLCRNGKVKLNGKVVGVWWEDDIDLYHFSRTARQDCGEVTSIFRHELKAEIPIWLDQKRNSEKANF